MFGGPVGGTVPLELAQIPEPGNGNHGSSTLQADSLRGLGINYQTAFDLRPKRRLPTEYSKVFVVPVMVDVDALTHRFQAMSLDVWNQNPNDFRLEEKDEAEGQMRMEGLYAICVHLVDQNPMVHFIGKIESVLGRWAILLTQTKMTCEILSTDRRVFAVLRALDKAITAQNGDKLLSRLAQVQLVRVLEALEARVAMERQNGHLHRRSGYRNASIVLDIYMSAQEMVPSISRRALIERKRVAKRWNELAGPWPLFLLVYSEEAEEIMFVSKQFEAGFH